jgi:hypothetical protein
MPYTFEVISVGPQLKTVVRGVYTGDLRLVSKYFGAKVTFDSVDQFTIGGCYDQNELNTCFRHTGIVFTTEIPTLLLT